MYKKGVSFSIIPIIALIGVLGLSIWAGYQLSIGSSYIDTSSGISEQDKATQDLESVKNMLSSGLEFSTTQAALDIARNGGTDETTYWYCSSVRALPEPEEVEFAMSTVTLDNLKAYVKTLREPDSPLFEINPTIPDYTCVGVFEPNSGDPSNTNCNNQDSVNCEKFATSAAGEPGSLIEIHEPVYVNDDAELEAHLDRIRFYWLYYMLYNDFKIKDHSQYMTIVRDCKAYVMKDGGSGLIPFDQYKNQKRSGYGHCYEGGVPKNPLPPDVLGCVKCCSDVPGIEAEISAKEQHFGSLPGSVKPDVEDGLRDICNHYENELFADDGYVSCEWEITCFKETGTKCLSSTCDKRSDPNICNTAPVISLQGDEPTIQEDGSDGSVRFKVTLTDNKFKIPSGETRLPPGAERELQELIWNINGEIQLTYTDCPVLIFVPVGGTEEGGGTGGPSDPGY